MPEGRDRLRTGLALELAAARALALGVAPMMPDFAEELWQALGYTSPVAQQDWDPKALFLPFGRRLFELERQYFPELPQAEEGDGSRHLEVVPVGSKTA